MKLISKETFFQLVKFGLVGVLNTLVDVGVFALCNSVLGLHYTISKIISFSAGVLNSYAWNSRWTFKEQRRKTKKQFLQFVCVNILSLGVSLGGMAICIDVLHIPNETLCNIIVVPLSMLVNFLGNRLFVFKENAPAQENKSDGDASGNGEK